MAEAGRVIAGSAKGLKLIAPLSDRVKQTLFAILEPHLPDARVLDLFAGSGAGGIEALSRRAEHADFVEKDSGAARVIGQNLVRAHLDEKALRSERLHIEQRASAAASQTPAPRPWDVVLIDPPYADTGAMDAALTALSANATTLLAPTCWVVAKHFWRTPPPQAIGLLASIRNRRFGETALTFYRLAAVGEAAGAQGEET